MRVITALITRLPGGSHDSLAGLGAQRGQASAMIALALGMAMVVAVLTVDFGIAFAERREAQTTADLTALAGTLELPRFDLTPPQTETLVTAAAIAHATANGFDPADPDTTVSVRMVWNEECYPGQGTPQTAYLGVEVSVSRFIDMPFMRALPGVADDGMNVGASALACAGTAEQVGGFVPWSLQEVGACYEDGAVAGVRTPVLGSQCTFKVGAQQKNGPVTGALGFDNPASDCWDGSNSANDYRTNIEDGTNAPCVIGDAVGSANGNMHGPTRQGTENRLATEGACDAAFFAEHGGTAQGILDTSSATFVTAGYDALAGPPTANDGVDDFFEVWDLNPGYDPANPAKGLIPRDCDTSTPGTLDTSPRNMLVLVVHDWNVSDTVPPTICTAGSECYQVQGYARMYYEGCTHANAPPYTVERIVADCEATPGGGDHNVHARPVEQLSPEQVTGELTFSTSGEFVIELRD